MEKVKKKGINQCKRDCIEMTASSYILHLVPTTEAAKIYYKSQEDRSDANAGYDLHVPEEHVLQPGEKKLISMRVKAKMESIENDCKTVHYWMPARSSIGKTGLILLNSIGVIDKTYRGELMAFVQNISNAPVTVNQGDRLVQIVAPDMGWIRNVCIVDELDATERGEGGFGSSGR